MDMLDFNQIMELLKVEPGHGLTQTILLFMIWLNSRGLKKEVITLGEKFSLFRSEVEARFDRMEHRLTINEIAIDKLGNLKN